MSATLTGFSAFGAVPDPRRLLTAADLAVLPDDLPSGRVKYELDDGRLIIMPPPGDEHSAIQLNSAFELRLAETAGHGIARVEVAIQLRSNPDRVVGADACFIANASLPIRRTPEGYLETIPDIVVEVRSKNDTRVELERKAGEYLAAGVKLVWVLDPIDGQAIVYQAGHPPKILAPGDELTAEGIIPGFRWKVADALKV